ncbi:MAG: PepSY-associated TM helix domain-containing protein, partial [bacterium]|nr:PepSY-associated TM helix domain-containing protein [bacterium]
FYSLNLLSGQKNMPSLKLPKGFEVWNRKLHIYVGLYFLLFIWLFSFSGLMLNHPNWEFTRYWQRRQENVTVHQIQPLIEKEDMARAREVMAQLKVSGEIEHIQVLLKERRFKFRVNRPGRMIDIWVNWEGDRAEMKEITTDGWGVLHMLHQFNGVRMDDSKEARDWFVTKLWTFSMDALCLGLIFLILSSLYMWYQIQKKRRLGLIVLGTGVLCCGAFIFGLVG